MFICPRCMKLTPTAGIRCCICSTARTSFFDEDATFGKSWGVADYLDYTDTPLIVAAVECNAGANNERLVEYSPYRFDDPQFGHFDGTGQATMSWYIHRFKPFIDRNFRTLPDREHTFIGGSSMGGLMSLYALFAVQRHFQPCGGAVAVHLGVAGKALRPCGPGKAGPRHRAVHGLRLPRDGQPRGACAAALQRCAQRS